MNTDCALFVLQTMDNRILNQRLNNERRNVHLLHLGINVDLECKTVAVTEFLNFQIGTYHF
ncbi:hypothetical protein D3C74_428780 [compost metagenome]